MYVVASLPLERCSEDGRSYRKKSSAADGETSTKVSTSLAASFRMALERKQRARSSRAPCNTSTT